MKKKLLLCIFLGVVSVLTIDAQNTIESIRKEYQAVHEMIELMKPVDDGISPMPPEYFTANRAEGLDSYEYDNLRNATFREVYSGKTIPEKFKDETDRCKQRANRFLEMFKGIDENTYL